MTSHAEDAAMRSSVNHGRNMSFMMNGQENEQVISYTKESNQLPHCIVEEVSNPRNYE